ncbi:metallo-beta-lactamase domain-containing protein 1 isoform X1 [Neodiprion pinetum]|uniref:metallo-beta-lactamase domain-containing protein 1 isoform X1 n=1 Tax=Neodiprion pinetum TaxID=441929 RepID=UPI001EDE9BB5|nr:metallo-beta-lactamase domain-containing protein 1 isoform X1 [Neodiprion pinetum]
MLDVVVLFNGYSKRLSYNRTDANCTCTLIKGPKTIIVDTMTAWDRERLVEALERHNVQPRNIDYVVCTHGHADHIGNNNLFLNAEHIVGYGVHQGTIFYEKQLQDEDYQLCNGVSITATPGHTYEDVTVLVEAGTGRESVKYAITGDLFEKEEDVADPSLWKEVGTFALRKIQTSSRLRIMKYADYIIPGHGPMFRTNDALIRLLENQTDGE